ncbi:HAD family hydrolase [Salinibacterium sp. NG22]|uniref:HAD family hydrolase n=1 Tax=Salinibacterium sp. NG22 TaxID=2792040 RepID=UPI0018CCCFA4|nr:HAD family hydrolase [Salinibacterium sp. NG22]MBH0109987.1 HAD family hydrolase [Salinibacterium sp. NG22]
MSTAAIHPRTHTIVFDFDGTIALGDGPIIAYARAIASSLTPAAADEFLSAVSTALLREPGHPLAEASDGYELVRLASESLPVAPDTHNAAYLASRELLATDAAPVTAPEGLADFLRTAREHATIVLATNAPDIRIAETLDSLGLADYFDHIYTSVGKPAGLDAVLDEWMPAGPLLSIGDIWANDLEPAYRRGATTAFLSDTPHPHADFTAATLGELYEALNSWLHGTHREPQAAPPTTTAPPAVLN